MQADSNVLAKVFRLRVQKSFDFSRSGAHTPWSVRQINAFVVGQAVKQSCQAVTINQTKRNV